MRTLTENVRFTRISNAVAPGVTVVNSASVDMTGFESVTFIVSLGAIVAGAATSVNAQSSTDDGDADAFADLAGTGVTVADDDDNQVVVLEVHNPRERYVRCVVSRATQNSTVDGIVALQGGPKAAPVTQDATTVVAAEAHHAPAAGTA